MRTDPNRKTPASTSQGRCPTQIPELSEKEAANLDGSVLELLKGRSEGNPMTLCYPAADCLQLGVAAGDVLESIGRLEDREAISTGGFEGECLLYGEPSVLVLLRDHPCWD